MQPWLTVIMPIHNGAPYLRVALASAAAEKPDGVEFRIYNSAEDGGAARSIADSFAGQLDIVWQDRPDLGNWMHKTNIGAAEARSEHFIMLHHDDFWLPGHIAAVRRAILDHPQVVMSIAPCFYVGPDGRKMGGWKLPFPRGMVAGRNLALALLVQNTICVTTPIIRRDAYLASGGVDPALWYSGDWDLYFKLAALGDVRVRSEITTAYRIHGGSQTNSGNQNIAGFRAQMERVLDKHLALLAPVSPAIERRARAAISLNCALAAGAGGDWSYLPGVLGDLVRLGFANWLPFLRETQILARSIPRLRLKLGGRV